MYWLLQSIEDFINDISGASFHSKVDKMKHALKEMGVRVVEVTHENGDCEDFFYGYPIDDLEILINDIGPYCSNRTTSRSVLLYGEKTGWVRAYVSYFFADTSRLGHSNYEYWNRNPPRWYLHQCYDFNNSVFVKMKEYPDVDWALLLGERTNNLL